MPGMSIGRAQGGCITKLGSFPIAVNFALELRRDATELVQARAFAVVLAGTTAALVTKERHWATCTTEGTPGILFVRCCAPAPDTYSVFGSSP